MSWTNLFPTTTGIYWVSRDSKLYMAPIVVDQETPMVLTSVYQVNDYGIIGTIEDGWDLDGTEMFSGPIKPPARDSG